MSEVASNFPATDYIVVTGDFNTNSRGESAINTLKTIFSDTHVPVDQGHDYDTSGGSGGNHTFTDDFGTSTTIAPPTGRTRRYRIGVSLP